MAGLISDRIAVLKDELRVSSTRELEKGGLPGDQWVISNGLLSTWEGKDPAVFRSTKLEKFLNFYKVNREWWQTGEGPIFTTNVTPVDKPTDNNGNHPDSIYKDFVEGNSDYTLIPKNVLSGEYRIELKSEIEARAKEREQTIIALNKLIAQYEKEIEELTAWKIAASAPRAAKNAK